MWLSIVLLLSPGNQGHGGEGVWQMVTVCHRGKGVWQVVTVCHGEGGCVVGGDSVSWGGRVCGRW